MGDDADRDPTCQSTLARNRLVRSLLREIYLGASHYLGLDKARQRLTELHDSYGLQQVAVTNTIPLADSFRELSFVRVRSLADTFARIVNRIHRDRSVRELFHSWLTTAEE